MHLLALQDVYREVKGTFDKEIELEQCVYAKCECLEEGAD